MSEGLFAALRSGLTRNRAVTDPGSADERLRGRTYAIPFETVWRASLGLVDGGLRGWSLLEADDQEGTIRAGVRGTIERMESAAAVRISLDPDAQTRVDVMSASPSARGDWGVNARRIGRFFRGLDQVLEAERAGARIPPATTGHAPDASWD